MVNSALSLREQHAQEVARQLRTSARHLTAHRGFSGFTIEELCARVGVSRRTFFNYFASKEHALFGYSSRTESLGLEKAFVSGGPTGNLLDDLAELQVGRWEESAMTRSEAADVSEAITQEPQLVTQFFRLMAEREQHDATLVAQREGYAPEDPRAALAVQLLGAFMRPSIQEFFAGGEISFRDLLRARLNLARTLLSD